MLTKNEAKHADMVEIMQTMQGYLGEEFPHDQKVPSGGDQLTCERQACVHVTSAPYFGEVHLQVV